MKFKKWLDRITSDSYGVKAVFGVMICLISLIGALRTGPVSEFLTWIISFFFGWFFYVFYFVTFLIGLNLILSYKKLRIKFDITICGLIILLVGALILATESMTTITTDGTTTYLTFQNFADKFNASIDTSMFPSVNTNQISGGLLGFLFVAILNSGMTNLGSKIVGSVLLCVGIIFSLIKLVIRLIKLAVDYKNSKIKKVESEFQTANNQKPYETSDMINLTHTSVEIPTEEIQANLEKTSTQSIAVQNARNGDQNSKISNENNSVFKNSNSKLSVAHFDPENVVKPSLRSKAENVTTPIYIQDTNDPTKGFTTTEILIQKEDEEVKEDIEKKILEKEAATPSFTKQVSNSRVDQQQLDLGQIITPVQEAIAKTPHENIEGSEVKIVKNGEKPKPVKEKKFTNIRVELLADHEDATSLPANTAVAEARTKLLNKVLDEFNVGGQIVSYTIGPSVTQYDLKMNEGFSLKGVDKYVDDMSSRIGGQPIRFVPVVPGKDTSGFEIPNAKSSLVNFKDAIKYLNKVGAGPLDIPFGKNVSGEFVYGDLRKFPHLLVSGTTGSGKSIFMHCFIMTLLMRNKPDELKIILIDPKKVEFNKYKDIPFLACPPINESNQAVKFFEKLVIEMDRRYDILVEAGFEDVKGYNAAMEKQGKDKIPYLVVLIDEYADLVNSNKKISEYVVRIAQKARASGIHMVIATQRPSTDVITGVIKGNIPTAVALLCANVNDSITILGKGGAEHLCGNGDMLLKSPLFSKTDFVRIQGMFISSIEIKNVCDYLRENYEPVYVDDFMDLEDHTEIQNAMVDDSVMTMKDKNDEVQYQNIKQVVMSWEHCSFSAVQREFSVGFNKAGKIVKRLILEGIVAPESDGPNRGNKVLVSNLSTHGNSGSIEQTTLDRSKKDSNN